MSVSLLEIQNAIGAVGHFERAAPVVLGGMVLCGAEVPDELVFGGRQTLVVHRIPGGGRVIDALGNDPARLVLSGRFIGQNAPSRARLLEKFRSAGQVMEFSVADFSVRVWIAEFSWTYQARGTICPYRLVLEQEEEPFRSSPGLNGLVAEDLDNSLNSISDRLDGMAEAGWIGTNQIIGSLQQLDPLIECLGSSGAIAIARDALTKAVSMWQTAISIGRTPSAVQAVGRNLSRASTAFEQSQSMSGDALGSRDIDNSSDLLRLARASGLEVLGVEGHAYLSRASGTLNSQS